MRRGVLATGALLLAVPAYAGTLETRVTSADGKPIPFAVVTATPTGQVSIPAKSGTKAVMVQEGKQFIPFVLPVQIGTAVAFPNKDPFRHQVYSFSPAKAFELKLYSNDEASTVVFDKEGAVALGCNIHDNMLAYVYVVGTPYFANSDANGDTKIAVPAGTYTVRVRHPNPKSGSPDLTDVRVTGNDTLSLTAKVELKRARTQRRPGAVDDNDY